MVDSQVFADGEPVDPIKLQKLQDQIREISQVAQSAYNLSSQTVDGTTVSYVYHTKAGVESFQNVASGKLYTAPIDVEWSSDYTNVYTVATPRLKDSSYHDVRVSFTGSPSQPTMVIYYINTKNKTGVLTELNVHWISVARKSISQS